VRATGVSPAVAAAVLVTRTAYVEGNMRLVNIPTASRRGERVRLLRRKGGPDRADLKRALRRDDRSSDTADASVRVGGRRSA
jgi:hypothetical protein